MKLIEIKAQFTKLTGFDSNVQGVTEYALSLGKTREEILGKANLSKKDTWATLLSYISSTVTSEQQVQTIEGNIDSDTYNKALIRPDHDSVMVMERQTLINEPVLEPVSRRMKPRSDTKKLRNVTPRITSYAINGYESKNFEHDDEKIYKLQVLGNSVGLMSFIDNRWKLYRILGMLSRAEANKIRWDVIQNWNKQAREISTYLYLNPNCTKKQLLNEFSNIIPKVFTEDRLEYIYHNQNHKNWERNTVIIEKKCTKRDQYNFCPFKFPDNTPEIIYIAIDKTFQWLRYMNADELNVIEKFKFRKRTKNNKWKYVSIEEELNKVYNTLLMLTRGKRGEHDLGYRLVYNNGDCITSSSLRGMANQLTIAGKRDDKGYLQCFNSKNCEDKQFMFKILLGIQDIAYNVVFQDDNGNLYSWDKEIDNLKLWLQRIYKHIGHINYNSLSNFSISQLYDFMLEKGEQNLSWESKLFIVDMIHNAPIEAIETYGTVNGRAFLSMIKKYDKRTVNIPEPIDY